MTAAPLWHALASRRSGVVGPRPTPDIPLAAPWATDIYRTVGVFHSSQSRADHETLEASVGRTFPFALRFLTGGWAGSGRPTSWTDNSAPGKNTTNALNNVLSLSSDWWVNRPDITMIISTPLLVGTQSYAEALADPNRVAFWRQAGQWCRDRGLLERHADGRPKIIFRPGWEGDASWYPWAMLFGGRSLLTSVGPFCDLFDSSREEFEIGAGTGADGVMWAYNVMCAHRSAAQADALAATVPQGADIFTQDSYDTLDGGSFYGTASSPKTQSQKDAAYPTVRNRILNGNTGRNWGVAVAEAHGMLYGLDETGPFFEEYAGQRHEVGGDHASPISWFQDELDWFQGVNGPFTKGIMAYHVIFNSVASGDEGSTKFIPAQSYSPNTRAAWLAAY